VDTGTTISHVSDRVVLHVWSVYQLGDRFDIHIVTAAANLQNYSQQKVHDAHFSIILLAHQIQAA